MEKRREVRYQLDAPALFSWENQDQERIQGEGVTRDISVFGAFIVTSRCPPVDVLIQVEVVLPSPTGIKPVIRVSGSGRVLRVEPASLLGGESGFAIVSDDFSRWSMTTVFANVKSLDGSVCHESQHSGGQDPVAGRQMRPASLSHC